MMFKYTFNMDGVASSIERAVEKVLEKGFRTADIYTEGTKKVGCSEMGDAVVGELEGK